MATPRARRREQCAFTLIELIVVTMIIAILLGLVVSASSAVFDRARKTQAKNDEMQIVTAVNAFYTEYGKYPLNASSADVSFTTDNSAIVNALRGVETTSPVLNTRNIAFLSPPQIGSGIKAGVNTTSGIYYDPWGAQKDKTGNTLPESGVYHIRIDGDYNNQIEANPYGSNNGAGPQPLRQGVIVWSFGKDGTLGKKGNNVFTGSDDVISWQ